jgi:UDPglucose 6-dehydrogenase
MRINAEQRQVFLKKVRGALWTLRGKKLAVLGLAFKGDTDDVRESPAIEIIEALLAEGAKVRAYDPAAIPKTREIAEMNGLEYAADAYDAMTGADALLILTEWREFAALDLNRVQKLLKYPMVIDGRNLYDANQMTEVGLMYYSVGRSVGVPKHLSAIAQEDEMEITLAAARAAASAA